MHLELNGKYVFIWSHNKHQSQIDELLKYIYIYTSEWAAIRFPVIFPYGAVRRRNHCIMHDFIPIFSSDDTEK